MVDMVSQVGFNRTPAVNYNNQTRANAQIDAGELTNCLLSRDKNVKQNENGNYYTTTNTGKKLGAFAGVLTPLIGKIIGGGLKSVLNLKTLLISCPALAAAGFGIGALLDHIVNTKRSQQSDENAQQNTPGKVYYQA